MAVHQCESCGMPLEHAEDHALGDPEAVDCTRCAPDGALVPFEERFERMVQWQLRSGGTRDEAEQQTRAYMRTMPAWRDHPALAE